MKPARIHRTALGGFAYGPYYVRRSRAAVLAERFFHWLGA